VSALTPTASLELFAQECGLELEPFQKRIAKAVTGPEAEVLITLGRGNGKTSLLALIALHHLATVPDAEVYVVAASRRQATELFKYAERYARRLGNEHVVHRHLLLRWCPDPGEPKVFTRMVEVLASDYRKLHGTSFSLGIVDELAQHESNDVYEAMATGLHKRPGARLITISTAGQGADSPLGRLRARALAQPSVKRRGACTDARGPGIRMLEWSVDETADLDNIRAAKQANPASWVTLDELRRQRQALPEIAYRRYLMNQWTAKEGHWLPAGSWQQCVGDPEFTVGEAITVGVDLGGGESSSALAWINDRLQVGVGIYDGETAILDVADHVRELAMQYQVREVAFDPWNARQLGAELEREGLLVTAWPQQDSRAIPASKALYEAIVGKRIVLPDSPDLAAHAQAAIATHSRRGWRIGKPRSRPRIDGVVALMMALDASENRPEPVKFLGWLDEL
jgi:phage terminase large subunit-like protein